MEKWKQIKEFEGYYEVSNYGRVRSLPRIIKTKNGKTRDLKGKFLNFKLHWTGYHNVFLSKNGEKSYVGVHRLVAIHFIDNPNNLDIVNHINEKRNLNHYSNLEWVSHGENLAHNGAFQRGREKVKRKVYQYTVEGVLVRTFSYAGATSVEGFNSNMVTQVCLAYKKTHKGFIWRY